MELNDCLMAIKKYLWVVLVVTTVSSFSAWAVSQYIIEEIYESTSSIIISGKNCSYNPQLKDILLAPNYIKAFFNFAQSNTVAENTIGILKLTESVESLRKKVDMNIDYETGVMKIIAHTNNPDLSKKMVQACIDSMKQKSESQILNVNIHIVDSPKVSLKPVSPNIVLNVLLSIAGGIMLGILLSILFYSGEQTKSEVFALKKLPSLFILGYLPKISARYSTNLSNFALNVRNEDFMKTMSSNLQFLLDSKNFKTIMVTSPRPFEGSSTLAVSIAASYKSLNKRVLVIDCNFQRPSLYKIKNIKSLYETSEYQTVNEYRVKTIESLRIDIISDVMVPQENKRVSLPLLQKMIETMEKSYNLIIIDCPAIMANSDAILISRIIKNVLIIADYSRLSYRLLEKCMARFTQIGSSIIGIVVNRTPQSKIT